MSDVNLQSEMDEAQKMRDREILGIRSTNSNYKICHSNYKIKNRIHKIINYIKTIIQDSECYGPAGLIHIAVLSNIIERPIKIWNANGTLNTTIGRAKTGYPVDIEYHASDSEEVGHWTLRGGKDPDNVIVDLNSCLFSVIGSQIGQNPLRLRKWTVLKLKDNFRNLVEWMDKILPLEGNDKIILMIGGASYTGTTPEDAAKILDESQGSVAEHFPFTRAHPRCHVSVPVSGPPCKDSVEYHSLGDCKTSFLSRQDQDYIINLALKTEIAQTAIVKLNNSKMEETITIHASSLGECTLPKIKKWVNGREIHCTEMEMVVLTLRHHVGKFNDREANVLVYTCFPKASEMTCPEMYQKYTLGPSQEEQTPNPQESQTHTNPLQKTES